MLTQWPAFDYRKCKQYHYAQDVHSFQRVRFAYYLSQAKVTPGDSLELLRADVRQNLLQDPFLIQQMLEGIERLKPTIFIVTATYNRSLKLEQLYRSILRQQFPGQVAWIIVENGSTDETMRTLQRWTREHDWIFYLQYTYPFGYAAPARNRGLSFVQVAARMLMGETYVWVIDSDDYLHNDYVLQVLYEAARCSFLAMVHGYAVCRYEDKDGRLVTVDTIPRDLRSGFPCVKMLKDEFDMGPQVLSALFPCEHIPHFYYPDEFTMEDDALNRRIMTWSMNHGRAIRPIHYPCIVKTFHQDSMSGCEYHLANEAENPVVKLGPKTVDGLRAKVALGLQCARDYFTKERV